VDFFVVDFVVVAAVVAVSCITGAVELAGGGGGATAVLNVTPTTLAFGNVGVSSPPTSSAPQTLMPLAPSRQAAAKPPMRVQRQKPQRQPPPPFAACEESRMASLNLRYNFAAEA